MADSSFTSNEKSLFQKVKSIFIPEEVVSARDYNAQEVNLRHIVTQYNDVAEQSNYLRKELDRLRKLLGTNKGMGQRIEAARSKILTLINESREFDLKPERRE